MVRFTLAIALVSALSLVGCGKKPSDTAKASGTPRAPAALPEKSTDIFDEFYREDTGAGKAKASTAGDQTFTTKTDRERGAKATPSTSASVARPSSTAGRYVVQVSTLRSRSAAERMANKLLESGYAAYVSEVQNPTPDLQGTYHRVRISGFDDIADAKSFGQKLLEAGYQFWVDKKSNDNVGMEGYGFGRASSGTYGYTPASSSSGYSSSGWDSSPSTSTSPATTPAPQESSPAATPSSEGSTWGKDDWGSSQGGW